MALTLALSSAADAADVFPSEMARLAADSLLLGDAHIGTALIAVGGHGVIIKSDDGGKSWRQIQSPTDILLTSVSFANDKVGLIVGHDGTVMRTEDGGETWALLQHDPETGPLMTVSLAPDGLHGFAGGAYGTLLITADGGKTWTKPDVPEDDHHLYASAMPAPDCWVVVGEGGHILVSDNQGAAWRVVDAPYNGSFFGILARSAEDWLVFGLEGKLLETKNAGKSWAQIDTGQSAGLTAAASLPDGRLALVGLGGTFLVESTVPGVFNSRRLPTPTALTGIVPVDGTVLLLGEAGASRADPSTLAAAK